MLRAQPLIQWDPGFNTGHDEIDRQHRALVELLNGLAVVVVEQEQATVAFHAFCHKLREHFAYEEQVLRKMDIPSPLLRQHTQHHVESMLLLDHLDSQLTGDPGTYSSSALAELAQCLLKDLLDEDRYCLVTTSRSDGGAQTPPIAPALHAFSRLFSLLNDDHERIVQARDYYLTLLDDFPTPVCRIDAKGSFDWFNRTWCSLTGKPPEAHKNGAWITSIHPDDRETFVREWRHNFETRIPFSIEYRIADATGSWCSVHHIGHPFFDNADCFLGYICTLFDITELRRQEAYLRVSAAVFEHATEAIMITDPEGRIEAVNPAFTRISGYSADEVVGAGASVLRSGYHDDDFYRSMWADIKDHGLWQGEIVNRRKSGELFSTWLSINAIRDGSGRIFRIVGVFSEIASERASQERLMYLAHHDALTGLPNRLLFEARGQHSIERCEREKSGLAMLFVDLDNFKPVNDLFGHKAGDTALKTIAGRLRQALRSEDTMARLGGDEFVALVERAGTWGDARKVAEKLQAAFPVSIEHNGRCVEVSASIGISIYPDDGTTVDQLLESADHRMYLEKQARQKPQR